MLTIAPCRAIPSAVPSTLSWPVRSGALPIAARAEARADPSAGLFEQRCSICHGSLGEGAQGPSLRGMVGRQAGATRYGYSRALRGAGFSWSPERLDAYLANPAAAVPGTTMALQTTDAASRRAIIAYLATLPSPDPATDNTAAPSPRNTVSGGVLAGDAAFGDWGGRRPRRATLHSRHRSSAAQCLAVVEQLAERRSAAERGGAACSAGLLRLAIHL